MRTWISVRHSLPAFALVGILSAICIHLYTRANVQKQADARFESSLIDELHTVMNTLAVENKNAAQAAGKQCAQSIEARLITPPSPVQNTAGGQAPVVSVEWKENPSGGHENQSVQDLNPLRRRLRQHGEMIRSGNRRIAELAAMHERTTIYFSLTEQKAPIEIDEVGLLLKRTDPKRNRFTLEVTSNNKKVEQKNRNAMEAILVYVSKYDRPCQIVIRKVGRNQIWGYLSVPRAATAAVAVIAPK